MTLPFYFVPGRIASFTTTSFTNQSFTNSLDLQEELSITLKNFVKANWPSTSILKASQIKFGTKWNDSYGSYQIHFMDSNIHERSYTIGWQYTYLGHMIDVMFWVRKNSLTRPAELDDMKRAVSYIIQTNRVKFPIAQPYATAMHVVREFNMSEGQPLETLWRAIVQVEIMYWKATSN